MNPSALRARAVVLRDAFDLMIGNLDRLLEIIQPAVSPYHPGFIAGCELRSIDENPYPPDDPEYETWRAEYLRAKDYCAINKALKEASDRMEKANPGLHGGMRAMLDEIASEAERELSDHEILDEALRHAKAAQKSRSK